jgi:hypothetical protein
MDELFSDMQQKGLIEFKKTCGLISFLKRMCDADFRKKHPIKELKTFELINTIPLPLDLVSIKHMECNHRTNLEVGEDHTEIKIIEQRN